MPTEPPSACSKRQTVRAAMVSVRAQPSEASANIASPAYSGGLRPKRSTTVPDQLAAGHADEAGQCQFGAAGGCGQTVFNGGEGRQIHVDCQRADGRERAQDQQPAGKMPSVEAGAEIHS